MEQETQSDECSTVLINALSNAFDNPGVFKVLGKNGVDITEHFYSENCVAYEQGNYYEIKEYIDSNVEMIYKDEYVSENGITTPYATRYTKTATRTVSYHNMVSNNNGVSFEGAYILRGKYYYYKNPDEIFSADDVTFEWTVNPFDMTYRVLDPNTGEYVVIGGEDVMSGSETPIVSQNSYSISSNGRSIVFTYKFTFRVTYIVDIIPVEYTFPTYSYTFSGAI